MPTPLSLVFNVAAIDTASAVFARVGAAAGAAGAESEAGMAKVATAGSKLATGFGIAAAAVTVFSVKMAADFQTATNQLVTSAGETASNLGMIRKGLLDMAGQVGVSATELAKGMYQVESAGFHGARGLDVMKAAAQGAKAEGAQMETVAGALTTVLNNYGKDIQENAVKGTNFLVATVSLGKTRMEDFSSSISNVLPVAKSAGIGLAEVGGAMATMTAQGISSDQAATYLRQTIVKLADQTPKAKNEMKALGLESIDVAGHLGERGLAGTLQLMTDAIAKHLGPGGLVMLDSLKKAGQNAEMFQATLTNLPPAAQTYIGALTTMVGGQKTMMGALSLTGDHMKTFTDDTAKISKEMARSGAHVNGFALVQTSFNQQLSRVKASLGAIAIEMGTNLLPAVTAVAGFVADKLLPALKVLGDVISVVFKGLRDGLGYILDKLGGVGLFATVIGTMALALAAVFTAQVAYNVALGIGTILQGAFNAIMALNPIVLVAVALAGLVAGVLYAYKHFKGFHDMVDMLWQKMQQLAHLVAGAFVTSWHAVGDALRAVATFAERMWKDVTGFAVRMWHDVTGFTERMWHDVTGFFQKMYDGIVKIARDIGTFLHEHWRLLLAIVTAGTGLIYIVVQDHWKAISGFFARIYHDVTDWVSRMWHDVSGFFSRMWSDVTGWVSRMWKDITGFFSRMWADVTGWASRMWADVSGFFSRMWNDVTGWTSRMWHDVTGFFTKMAAAIFLVISPFIANLVANWRWFTGVISGAAEWVWHAIVGFFDVMSRDVTSVFDRLVRGVGRIWDTIKDLISAPVRWVVDIVYNHGILPLLHGIGGVLHEQGMQSLQEVHFASGGVVPGAHGRDDVPIYGTPGEVVVPLPTVARFGGPTALMSMLGFGGGGGASGHYSLGGIVSGIGHGIASAADSVVQGAEYVAGKVAGMVRGGIGLVAEPIIHGLTSLADRALNRMGGFGEMMAKMTHRIGDALLSFIKGKDDADNAAASAASYGAAAGAPGGGVERWRSLVVQALLMNGLGPEYANGVLALINSESGGNPNAINLTDSNAVAGHPSRGLMQTIPTTFEAYRGYGLPDNIVDPLANVYAGIHYALKNYGPGMLMAGGRHSSGGGYLGYEMGTSYVPRDGLAYLHQGEAVVSKQQNAAGRHGPTVNMSGQFFAYDPTQLAEAQERKLRDAMALEGLSR